MKKQVYFISLLLLLLASSLAINGCDYITGAAVKNLTPSPEVINNITPEEAKNWLMASSYPIHIIDVRTPGEYADGHISGAINVDFNSADFKENISKLDQNARYLVYCRTGARSAAASQVMVNLGFKYINNMTGGFSEWVAQGFPMVK